MVISKPNLSLIETHLKKIAIPRDPFQNLTNLKNTQDYAAKTLRKMGFSIEKDAFEHLDSTYHNLIARRGPMSTSPRFLIGAHMDAVSDTDGADDNASGVVGLLEAARILSEAKMDAHVDFVLFNLEEYGMVGSTHYVKKLKSQKTPLSGMVSLEMIGFTCHEKGSQKIPIFLRPFYPDKGNFIALVGDNSSKKLLRTAKQAFKKVEGLPSETLTLPAKGLILPETRLSDHSPFWDAGYPALLITDTSFFRNPHYHTDSDCIETLDLNFLSKVIEGVVQLAISLS